MIKYLNAIALYTKLGCDTHSDMAQSSCLGIQVMRVYFKGNLKEVANCNECYYTTLDGVLSQRIRIEKGILLLN